MTSRRVLGVLGASLTLLGALHLLLYSLYASDARTVSRALDDRLEALGRTAAAWLVGAEPGGRTALLAALAAENHLEDAYLVGPDLGVVTGARTPAGTRLNLLRADPTRLEAALAGRASVGPGYSLEGVRVTSGYFPVRGLGALALEAGAEFRAPALRARATYLTAAAVSVALAAVVTAGLLLALRALERARLAHGRAERLAAVGQLAAMVAHEVRNPLGILRAQVELLGERLADGVAARERERLAEMMAEVDRLTRLTEEFLALGREAPLARAPISARELLEETAAKVSETPAGAAAALVISPVVDGLVIDGDRDRLGRALFNLALNAAQVGGAGVHVVLAAERRGGEIRLSVADDGPGVPAEWTGQIFEPFVTRRAGGSGLGLAVARDAAERHGGRLVLEPGASRGAVFSLYLPA